MPELGMKSSEELEISKLALFGVDSLWDFNVRQYFAVARLQNSKIYIRWLIQQPRNLFLLNS